jgi:hypothetical protein
MREVALAEIEYAQSIAEAIVYEKYARLCKNLKPCLK